MRAGRAAFQVTGWLAAFALFFSLLPPLPAGRAQGREVDLALILAIDCSYSVDSAEFALQVEGLARAFRTPEIRKAIAQGTRQRIAVAAVQWSDLRHQKIVVPWTVVSAVDADAFGQGLGAMQRQLAQGGTSISAVLGFAGAYFRAAPSAERHVIDVSTDGRNNNGPPVAPVRDRLVAEGVTINGLAILNEWPTLDVYFTNNVAGGAGHFVIPANSYNDYGEAILRKLLREITAPGVT